MKKAAAFFGLLEVDTTLLILFISVGSIAAEANDPFAREEVIPIAIIIEPSGIASLRETPRGYVQGKVGSGTHALGGATVRLR